MKAKERSLPPWGEEDDSASTSSSTDSNASINLPHSHSHFHVQRTRQSQSSPPIPTSLQLPSLIQLQPSSFANCSMDNPRRLVAVSSFTRRHRHRGCVLNIAAPSNVSGVLASRRRTGSRTTTPATARAVRTAVDMRTRSSRLFVVLLHLVGVSTIVPSSPMKSNHDRGVSGLFSFLWHLSYRWSHAGIVGVHPTAILLERLHVEASRHGLRGVLDRLERDHDRHHADPLAEPFWFQDTEGRCLDPNGGLGDCGDATLWRVRRRPLSKREARERRYRKRQREKLRAREKGRRKMQEKGDGGFPPQQDDTSSSPVCVWPFFCEHDSQFLQQSSAQMNEILGDEAEGFALQLMELDAATSPIGVGSAASGSSRRRFFWNFNHLQQQECEDDVNAQCLASSPSNNKSRETALQLVPCSSRAAWVWHVNRDGILVHTAKRKRKHGLWGKSTRSSSKAASAAAVGPGAGVGTGDRWLDSEFECAHHRSSSVSAVLLPCDRGRGRRSLEQETNADASLVKFSLVRYPSTSLKKGASSGPQKRQVNLNDVDAEPPWEPWTALERPTTIKDSIPQTQAAVETNDETEQGAAGSQNSEKHQMPTSLTSSQNHASAFAAKPNHKQLDLKSTVSMLHTSVWEHAGVGNKAEKDTSRTSASHIRDAPMAMDGVAFHNQHITPDREKNVGDAAPKGVSTTKVQSRSRARNLRHKQEPKNRQTPIHDEPTEQKRGGEHHQQHGPGYLDSNPHRPRKIPVHPYIQSSKDFVWVDPLTSLEYPTDLCHYLGHTKADAGRHTLMGVGQYYRTAFNIKVYGAALYVAKRDVLADPTFAEYALLSAKELRDRADFYEHLMNAPYPENNERAALPVANPAKSPGGHFDRTLFIKINMQLSTDAMRKSLEADWSLLTEEMKSLIINSSFKKRMADERMQRTIQAKVNSSNCSCGQIAPPELEADPSCCARGTELVFTWRKNGDFEIRMDGRIMDVFPRPDIAKGLFSEYLNDNPISLDAKAHFADGFPFLLAPLAQVKGMSSAVPLPSNKKEKSIRTNSHSNPVHRLMDAAVHSVEAVHTQAQTFTKWMQDGAVGVSSSAIEGAIGVARELNDELDRQRKELLDNALALQKEGIELLSSLIKQSREDEINDGKALAIVNQAIPSLSPFSNEFDIYNKVHVEILSTPREFMPDEIGIKIEPNMNFTHRLFFTTVHIYLLLLFVLSLPGSYTTRRLVVVKRRILEGYSRRNTMQKQNHTFL